MLLPLVQGKIVHPPPKKKEKKKGIPTQEGLYIFDLDLNNNAFNTNC